MIDAPKKTTSVQSSVVPETYPGAGTEPPRLVSVGVTDRRCWPAMLGALVIAFSGDPRAAGRGVAVDGGVLPLRLRAAGARRCSPGSSAAATATARGASARLAWAAGVMFAADLTFWHHSIEAVGAGLATVLGNIQVVLVGLMAWVALGERPENRSLVAIPVVFAGVTLISGVIGSGAYGDDPLLGVVYGVLTGDHLRALHPDPATGEHRRAAAGRPAVRRHAQRGDLLGAGRHRRRRHRLGARGSRRRRGSCCSRCPRRCSAGS